MNEKEKALITQYQAVRKRKRRRIFIFFFFLIFIGAGIFTVLKVNQNSTVAEEKVIEKKEKDTKEPTLELTASEIEITQGTSISYDSYIKTAKDNVDGDLKKKVVYNEIDTNTIGAYSITYTVKDKAGNEKSATLKVKVIEKKEENPVQNEDEQKTETIDRNTQNEQNNSSIPQESNPQQTEAPSALVPIFFSVEEYGSQDNAMNACYDYMDANGGSCKPVRNPDNGEWLGEQYNP